MNSSVKIYPIYIPLKSKLIIKNSLIPPEDYQIAKIIKEFQCDYIVFMDKFGVWTMAYLDNFIIFDDDEEKFPWFRNQEFVVKAKVLIVKSGKIVFSYKNFKVCLNNFGELYDALSKYCY